MSITGVIVASGLLMTALAGYKKWRVLTKKKREQAKKDRTALELEAIEFCSKINAQIRSAALNTRLAATVNVRELVVVQGVSMLSVRVQEKLLIPSRDSEHPLLDIMLLYSNGKCSTDVVYKGDKNHNLSRHFSSSPGGRIKAFNHIARVISTYRRRLPIRRP